MGNYTTPEHWWFVDDYHLRISLLPIDKVGPFPSASLSKTDAEIVAVSRKPYRCDGLVVSLSPFDPNFAGANAVSQYPRPLASRAHHASPHRNNLWFVLLFLPGLLC